MTASDQLPSGALRVRVGPTGNVFYEAQVAAGWPAADQAHRAGLARARRRRLEAAARATAAGHLHREDGGHPDGRADPRGRRRPGGGGGAAQRAADLPRGRPRMARLGGARHAAPAAATLRDYRSSLAEPGTPHRTGRGKCEGRIMAALGDKPIDSITVRQISALLREFDKTGVSTRTVNKKRQVLSSIFNYARREDTYQLAAQPGQRHRQAPRAARRRPRLLRARRDRDARPHLRRRRPPRPRLRPRRRRHGPRRRRDRRPLRRGRPGRRDAPRPRLHRRARRRGRRPASGQTSTSTTAASSSSAPSRATSKGPTKSWQVRYVPLAEPAHQALRRLAARTDFTSRDDYVFVNRLGRRIEPSAYRRRFHRARQGRRACATSSSTACATAPAASSPARPTPSSSSTSSATPSSPPPSATCTPRPATRTSRRSTARSARRATPSRSSTSTPLTSPDGR